jgi:hypothetical protein
MSLASMANIFVPRKSWRASPKEVCPHKSVYARIIMLKNSDCGTGIDSEIGRETILK